MKRTSNSPSHRLSVALRFWNELIDMLVTVSCVRVRALELYRQARDKRNSCEKNRRRHHFRPVVCHRPRERAR
jgi:hypothetical protein